MAHLNTVLRRVGLGFAAAAVMYALPADAADVKISKSAFSFGAARYYRGKAENVRLGSYGEKKTPISQANYLAIQNHVTADNLAKVGVAISGPYPIEWAKQSKTEVEANATTYVKAGGATASFTHEAAKSANLVLMKFALTEGALKTLLNKHASGARKFLADEGADGRIVSEVWVVMEATLASQVKNTGSVTGTGSNGGLEVTVKASTSTTTTTKISLPPDTTFAYQLHKVKDWGKNKETVEDLEDDQHGPF